MYEELIRFRQALFTVLAAILLLLVVISYLLADSITRPLLGLSECLKEMKIGNWSIRAKGGNDETGVLAEALMRWPAAFRNQWMQSIGRRKKNAEQS